MVEAATRAKVGQDLLSTAPGSGVWSVSEDLIGTALRAALEQRSDGDLLPPSEPQAIIHPNGFVKLPLARTGDGSTRLFLHVWRAESMDADVHDHRWAFSSVVLRGELFHTVMDVAVTSGSAEMEEESKSFADAFPVARYYSDGHTHRFDMSHNERAVVNDRRRYAFSAGRSYDMEAFVFHRAHALAGAMTFVARRLPERPCSRLLMEGSSRPRVTQRWCRLGAAEKRQQLRDALQALG
ncbi:hypothetical protein ACFV2N_44100 [Streptomyces sp. NPDC059680]|uniref:hypothetical protein n=1 Tax=Streptomyces sp. NPDC059680 TaxID=3346904 RepID=UPI0036AAA1C5